MVVVPPAGGVGAGVGAGLGEGDGDGASGLPPPHETTASEPEMVKVKAARLAAQMERGMKASRETRRWKFAAPGEAAQGNVARRGPRCTRGGGRAGTV